MFLQILLTTVFTLAISFVQPIFAQEEPILFWGTTCPYCKVVKEEIVDQGLDTKVSINELEIYENKDNLKIFQEKIEICKISSNNAGVPLLFSEGECFVGVEPILTKLNKMAGVDGEKIVNETEDKVEDVDKGKNNTQIMIFAGILSLFVLVVIGYILQNKKGKSVLSMLLVLGIGMLLTKPTYAICPVCTVAVGAGLGFSRYLGIDDVIIGVWIGGLVTSSTMWMITWLEGKKIKSTLSKVLAIFSMYGFLGLTLYLLDIVGHPLNQLWGIDKVLLGIVTGSIFFFLFAKLHFYIKEKNKGEVYIPFQKVVFTVGSLLLLTILFYIVVY